MTKGPWSDRTKRLVFSNLNEGKSWLLAKINKIVWSTYCSVPNRLNRREGFNVLKVLKKVLKDYYWPNSTKLLCPSLPQQGQKMLLIFITWLLPGGCYEYTHQQNIVLGTTSFEGGQHWYFTYEQNYMSESRLPYNIVRCYLKTQLLFFWTLYISILPYFVEHKYIYYMS